jgi:hypothetical protein
VIETTVAARCPGEDAEGRSRDEGITRQQPAADQLQLGVEQPLLIGDRAGESNVAAEPRAGHARAWLAEVAVRPVRPARGADVPASRTGRLRLARFGIVEIEAPQIDPQRDWLTTDSRTPRRCQTTLG